MNSTRVTREYFSFYRFAVGTIIDCTKHFHNLMRTQRMMRTATDIVDTKNNGLPIDWVSCGRTLNRRGREKNNNEVSSGHNKWQSNLLCISLRICFFSNPVEALLCHWHSLTYHRGQCRIRNWTCARARNSYYYHPLNSFVLFGFACDWLLQKNYCSKCNVISNVAIL